MAELPTVSNQSLLLVDGDTRSLRVLEVSLRKAGFTVTPASSVQDALDKLELHAPDLIISETTFADGDGFDLRRRVRATADWADIPFIFLTAEAAIENKIRGLELGVDDYLTKPIYIKEIVTRINILLQKRQRLRFEERRDGRTRFAGRVVDMPVVDVIQTIEISRKSGVIQFVGERGRQAAIYFRDGRVIDAEAGTLQGEDAVYRLLTWSEGEFEVVFRTVRRREVIGISSQALLIEGMRRLDEWFRLLEQLPPLGHKFEVDAAELAARLGDVPDDNNQILRLIDGKRTLLEVIEASDVGDLECLQAVSRLYFEELLIDLDHGAPARPAPAEGAAASGEPVTVAAVLSSEPPVTTEPAAAVLPSEPPVTTEPAAPPPVSTEPAPSPPAASPTVNREAISPAAVAAAALEPGELMGGYRPSSLRLIDEAVAAAQAIDPTLFEDQIAAAEAVEPEAVEPTPMFGDEVPTPRVTDLPLLGANGVRARLDSPTFDEPTDPYLGPQRRTPPADDPRIYEVEDVEGGNGVSPDGSPIIPLTQLADDRAIVSLEELLEDGPVNVAPPKRKAKPTTVPPPTRQPSTTPRREEPGLRMIGSLGRDRAEASGELVPHGARAPMTATQRELVTILPRRTIRTPAAPEADENEPESVAAIEPPVDAATVPEWTGGRESTDRVATASRTRSGGPGPVPIVLLGAAAVLAGIAVFLWIQRSQRVAAPPGEGSQVALAGPDASVAGTVVVPSDAAVIAMTLDAYERRPPDAAIAARAPDAQLEPPPPIPRDAAVAEVVDAGAGPRTVARDAGTAVAATVDAAPARPPSPRQLLAQANDAIQEGDFANALKLADSALGTKASVQGHLVRAQALLRLERVDDALEAVDDAERLSPSSAAVWETRGSILWASARYEEARDAYDKFLQLDPDSPRAAQVRRRLATPR
ncbi:MAG: DUF4388 domain-containing protein [Kofleriaceae bacterium]